MLAELLTESQAGCLMAPLEVHDALNIQEWARERIPADFLAADGFETATHVTVLFGFHEDVTDDEIAEALKKFGRPHLDIELKEVTRFSNDIDVIIVKVESTDLEELHIFLCDEFRGRVTKTFKDYKAHLTLAYVTKGACSELDDSDNFNGQAYRIKKLHFSTANKMKTEMLLSEGQRPRYTDLLIESITYDLPASKDRLMFDFYGLAFISAIDLDEAMISRSGLADDIKYAEDVLLPALKTDMLNAVFFSVCAEARHIFDNRQDWSNFSEPEQAFWRDYGKRMKLGSTSNLPASQRERVPIDKSVSGSSSSYDWSYKMVMKTIAKLGITKTAFMNYCENAFRNGNWSTSYGGRRWGDICAGWLHLASAETVDKMYMYIDHVWDLQHNTGTVFNKVQEYSRSGTHDWIKKALDFKAQVKDIRSLAPNMTSKMKKLVIAAVKASKTAPHAIWLQSLGMAVGPQPGADDDVKNPFAKKSFVPPKPTSAAAAPAQAINQAHAAANKQTWTGGVWDKPEPFKGEWQDGVWKDGVWEDGDWKAGRWKTGEWKAGIFHSGTWGGGDWKDGIHVSGEWKDGVWHTGLWVNGVWRGGEWKGGAWKNGEWHGGTWHGGKWANGTWLGGEWKGGEWKKGKILDDGTFVESDVDPVTYFKQKAEKAKTPEAEPENKSPAPPAGSTGDDSPKNESLVRQLLT